MKTAKLFLTKQNYTEIPVFILQTYFLILHSRYISNIHDNVSDIR